MPPSASEPESGSVIAQAPILSSVIRSSAQRSICAGVPSLLIVPAASPLDTPSDVSSPGLTRHSSIVEISWAAGSEPRRSRDGSSPEILRCSWRAKLSLAISLRPKTSYIFRRIA